MAVADLHEIANGQRRELLAVDATLASALVDAYAAAWRRIQGDLEALTAQIAVAGEEAREPAWLLRQVTLRALEARIVAELAMVARSGNGAITAAQWSAVRLAQEHARGFVAEAMGSSPPGVALAFALLPTAAIAELVGQLADGRPLSDLLDQLGPDASAAVREALTTGLVVGEGVDAIARRARAAFGGSLARALTISRTEVLRAYREANRRSYAANPDVVTGWRWMATLGPRTCAFCYAMHGTIHRLDEPMATHPRCRCTMAPIVRTWADLGYDVPEEPQRFELGTDAFDDLDDDAQRAILGPGKFAAFKAGAIALDDLAGTRRAAAWGTVGYEKSLTAVIGAGPAREFHRQQ